MNLPFDLQLPDTTTWTLPMRIGATLGLTAGGALIAGLLVQITGKLLVRVKAPGPLVNLFRIAGGLAGGLLAVMWLFGTGSGFGLGGGSGGNGLGGPGNGGQVLYTSPDGTQPVAPADEKKENTETGPKEGGELRIEILFYKVLNGTEIANNKFYRVGTPEGAKQMNLGEVINYIARLKVKPSAVVLVDYLDSSYANRETAIGDLRKLAADLKIDPEKWIRYESVPRNSPRPK